MQHVFKQSMRIHVSIGGSGLLSGTCSASCCAASAHTVLTGFEHLDQEHEAVDSYNQN